MNTSVAVAVGAFVIAAYEAYDGLADETVLRPAVVLPSAAFDLVAWVTMEDFIFRPGNERERRFYGYLAHETNTDHYVLALRGTEGSREWWDDVHVALVPVHEKKTYGRVAYGFSSIYGTLDVAYVDDAVVRAHAESFVAHANLEAMTADEQVAAVTANLTFAEKIGRMVRIHQAERSRAAGRALRAADVDLSGTDVTIAGHSLGAALSTLFVLENDANDAGSKVRPSSVYTFGSPRVGDAIFAGRFDRLDAEKWRIYNEPDIVPHLPLALEGFVHVERPFAVDTRLDLSIASSFSCRHSMSAYLSALGGPPLSAFDVCRVT